MRKWHRTEKSPVEIYALLLSKLSQKDIGVLLGYKSTHTASIALNRFMKRMGFVNRTEMMASEIEKLKAGK